MKYILTLLLCFCCTLASAADSTVRDFGAKGDGVSDDTAAIQQALDAGGVVQIPTGNYRITSTLTVGSDTTIIGQPSLRHYESKQASRLQCAQPITLLALKTHSQNVVIRGINIHGGGKTLVGIDTPNAILAEIDDCSFTGIATGGAAIRAGGGLFITIHNCTFTSGQFYALDAQNGYSPTPDKIYYGINVGEFSRCIVSCSLGVRFEGIMDFVGNDFEMAPGSAAVLDINSAKADSYVNVRDNYFELQKGSASPVRAVRLNHAVASVTGNRIYGANANEGIAIELASTYAYPCTIEGNLINRFSAGVSLAALSDVSDVSVGVNQYINVTTPVTGILPTTTVFSPTQNKPAARQFIHVPGIGWKFSGAVIGGAVMYQDADATPITTLNLAKGNVQRFDEPGPRTITAVSNAIPGTLFVVGSKFGKTKLANAAFNLAIGRDVTIPAGRYLQFVVDPDGVVREVGDASARMTVR